MTKHPIQPLETDERGVLRFKSNAIVCHLLDNGGIDMNQLARLPFSREDREQFAQLIGYSLSGAAELDYMSEEVLEAASLMRHGHSEQDARAQALRDRLVETRNLMREGVARLYGIHPDDLLDESES